MRPPGAWRQYRSSFLLVVRGGKCGGQGRDARRPRHSVRADEDQREQRDDPRARDLPVPAAGTDQPAGPGEGVHMVIDLTGRAEALVLAELEIGRASCRERAGRTAATRRSDI